jgi:hypothetical protein
MMYDPDSPTNMFNYPTPDVGVGVFFIIAALTVFGFVVMFCSHPAFSMWLFSINQHGRKKVSTNSSNAPRHKKTSDYGYGYGKYKCVDDEAVYDEVVYETEPPVKRKAKPPVKRERQSRFLPTAKPSVKRAAKAPVKRVVKPPVKRVAKAPVKRSAKPPVKTTDSKVIEEAIGGMHHLGFKKTEAKKAVNRVCNGRIFTSAEELIKATLDRSNV